MDSPTALQPRRPVLDVWSVRAIVLMLVLATFVAWPSAGFPLIATKSFILALGTLIILALFILARLSRGTMVFPPLTLVGALWLPALAALASALFGGTVFSRAFWGSLLEVDTAGFLVTLALLSTLVAFVLRREEQYRAFFKTLFGIGLILALLEIVVVLVGQVAPEKLPPGYSVTGSLADLATLFGLAVVSVIITLRFLEVGPRAKKYLLILGGASLLALAAFNITLIWILVALVSLGLFVEAVMRRRIPASDADIESATVLDELPVEGGSAPHSIAIPLGVLAISLFFLIGGTLGGALANALGVSTFRVSPSWQSTIAVGEQVYSDSPVFGSGPGTFKQEWLLSRDASLNQSAFWNIDFASGIGYVPTALATHGTLGLLAWLSFFGLFLFFGLRMLLRRTPTDLYARYAAILSFVGAVYLFVVAIFDLPGSLVLALAFILAGVFASLMRTAPGATQWGIIFAKSPRAGFVMVFMLTLLLLASVVGAYALVGRYIAATQLARATVAYAGGDLDRAEEMVGSALSFAPTPEAYELQASIAAARLGQIVSTTTLSSAEAQQAFQAALSSGIAAALSATRLAPDDYQTWLFLGNMYGQAVPLGVSGAYESAKDAFEKAAALSPTNPQIPFTLAQLDIARQDMNGAAVQLEAAIKLKQDYTAAILLLSQIYVQQGKVRDALNAALSAAYFTPNDPNVLFQVGVLQAAIGDLGGAAQAFEAAAAANPSFANARYLLAAVYAKQGKLAEAKAELAAIAELSAENAEAVAPQILALDQGRNPFPANLLTINPPATTPAR